MTATRSPTLRPIRWRNGKVALIDQTRLPHEEVWLELPDYPSVVAAIREMRVRGAPAIGIAGVAESPYKPALRGMSEEARA